MLSLVPIMSIRFATPDQIDRAVQLLSQGTPVVFPTETVYGLGAPVCHAEAVKKIFQIKGRPSDNPLIVHVSSVQEALQLSIEAPPLFFRLAALFWPGPLTMVLLRSEAVPEIVSAGQSSIAIRMPRHPVALQLIEKLGQPLAAPSANLSGRPSPTRASDAWEDLQGKVELILDGGECEIGIESTVISLLHETPVLLRPGSITQEAMEKAIGQKIALPTNQKDTAPLSPGMKYRHYAPNAHIRLVFNENQAFGSFILSPHPKLGERLLSEKTLYAELREADRLGAPEVTIYCNPSIQSNAALMNRLQKAASKE